MSDELLDHIRSCVADCVNGNETDRMTCEVCGCELSTERMWKRTCISCSDTEDFEIGGSE